MQSNLEQGLHVAVIMDGNRRWAEARGGNHAMGHAAGGQALRRIVEAAPAEGITTLTVYAFSTDNWSRSAEETGSLMTLLKNYLDRETEDLVRNGVRFSAIGRRDRLPADVRAEIERAEALTAWGDALSLRVAIDYSARDAILAAARKAGPHCTWDQFAQNLHGGAGNVDLLIRTANEQRLSDFLLWECAYAEMYFTPCLWPDFGPQQLAEAMRDFHGRSRRFGGGSAKAVNDAQASIPCGMA